MTVLPRKIADWPEDWQFLWNERAALMEFEGGLSRAEAERQAEINIRAQAEMLEPDTQSPLWKELGG